MISSNGRSTDTAWIPRDYHYNHSGYNHDDFKTCKVYLKISSSVEIQNSRVKTVGQMNVQNISNNFQFCETCFV